MTDLIEVKTADLVGEQLAWAVGKAEGLDVLLAPPIYGNPWRVFVRYTGEVTVRDVRFNPHENWAFGGTLQDKYLRIQERNVSKETVAITWRPGSDREGEGWGITHLEALCRSVVDLISGNTALVPKELMP